MVTGGTKMSNPAEATQESAGRRGLSQRAREELLAFVFISPWIFGFLVFTFGAMVFSLGLSFLQSDMLSETKFVGLKNYTDMVADQFSSPLFLKSLTVTFFYTFLTVPFATLIALGIAILLNQRVWPLSFWRTVYYLPAVVAGVAVALLWGWVLNPQYGLLNEALRGIGIQNVPRWFASEDWAVPGLVIISLWGTGTNMLLYLAGLQSIPTEVQEASKIDGANAWQVFRNVTLPLLTPTIFFNVVMNIIGSFQVFTNAYVLTGGGPNNATKTMVLYIYQEGFQQFHFGYASALAWVLFAIILVFTLLIVRSSAVWVYYEGGLRR
jgi:ABC-type sugar transport system permease subunit